MRALIVLLAALPACTLYDGSADDSSGPFPDGQRWVPDAWPAPDATVGEGCARWLPCPAANPGRVTICGRVLDAQTDDGIDVNAAGGLCDGSTLSGACHLWLRFYDADSFAQTTTTPLVPSTLRYDDCGRFVAANIPMPSSGYLGVLTDDAPGTVDDHAPTMTATRVWSGATIPQQLTYRLRRATDEAWTTQAGLGAQTFTARGAVLALFQRYDGQPPSDVQITADLVVDAANDHYFDGADRSTISTTLSATGANGGALRVGGGLATYGGTGGWPNGCDWGYDTAASVAGVLWVLPVVPFCKI